MNSARLKKITCRYSKLRIAVVGDFCLDRYLEIDPAKKEISIETGLEVYNVVNVRSQPGGAGTIVNNLVALGIGNIFAIGFCGEDGEGYELRNALGKLPRVSTEFFFSTLGRRTFTYTKPLVVRRGKIPQELNRLDLKNWTVTPKTVERRLIRAVRELASEVDAIIVLDQADIAETGVVTSTILKTLGALQKKYPDLLILADSRRRLRQFPPFAFKMNRAELSAFVKNKNPKGNQIEKTALKLAKENQQPVFITLAAKGILGATPEGECVRIPAWPVRGEIDVVGAGDSVTANLTAALSSEASLREALEIANAAASVVVHKLGTTGTASVLELSKLLRQKS